ncbi:hypothetical protein ACU8DI_08820 [Psychroserpens sp. BH13MA-6]
MKRILPILFSLFTALSFSQNPSCNCCSDTQKAFDFWVGEWTVTKPDGTLAGHNTITKIQNGCVLEENWISANGSYTGTSHNYYNSNTQQWEQLWIDNQGQSLHLKGHRKGNQMVLKSDEFTNKAGKPYYHRITWTTNDDGSVRQYWETITDGTNVTVAFDGLYKKKTQ